jgi:general secretion pathway protein B
MSYILEALKKAQAERARGTIPDIETHPLTPPAPDHGRRRSAPLLLGGAALAVGVVIAVGWWSFARDAAQPGVKLTGDAASKATVVRETSVPPHAPAASPDAANASAVKPAPATARQAAPAVATAPPKAPINASGKAPSKAPNKAPTTAPTEAAAAMPAPQVAADKPPAAAKPEQIALLQDLPPQIQREIPTLAINGYIYASNPADRSVLINNRLRREGEQVAPGLTLEKLLPKEMVLNYRGYRYRIAY